MNLALFGSKLTKLFINKHAYVQHSANYSKIYTNTHLSIYEGKWETKKKIKIQDYYYSLYSKYDEKDTS